MVEDKQVIETGSWMSCSVPASRLRCHCRPDARLARKVDLNGSPSASVFSSGAMRIAVFFIAAALFGQAPSFDAASGKANQSGERRSHAPQTHPQRLTATNVTLRQLILYSYDLPRYRVEGPRWIDTERFDVEATTERPAEAPQFRLMLQVLRVDRFKLTSHRESRELRVYWLLPAKGGAKLHDPKEQAEFDKSGQPAYHPGMNFVMMTGEVRAFADYLSVPLGRPVLDRTGIEGRYFFHVEWAGDSTPPNAEPGPSLPTALQERFRLRLAPHREKIEMMVIDRAERPGEN